MKKSSTSNSILSANTSLNTATSLANTSLNTASNIGNYTLTTTGSNLVYNGTSLTSFPTVSFSYPLDFWIDHIAAILDEDTIMLIFNKLIESDSLDEETLTNLIKNTVWKYHFSEKFLLQYLDYLKESDIQKQHARELLRKEYKELALYFTIKNE